MNSTPHYPSSFSLDGKSILVTGGTGSFGRQFIKTVLERFAPRRLVIYSRDELKQFEMQQEFNPADYPCLRYFIGDVRDLERLKMALRDIEYVVHAAALKHVTVAEYNPTECVHTNITGAENIAMAAIACGVKKVMALSTDKAVNPINLYGASKLASDKILIAANSLSGKGGAIFSCVRYGNVVGSRGSVVPLFQNLIRDGATELPITDERMTRFWITIQQGVDFVLSCFEQMNGGEVFTPKMASMHVVDLADALKPGISRKVIGIRPGEKLHEMLISPDHSPNTLEFDDRFVILNRLVSQGDNGVGRPVGDDFSYSSDNNPQWLDQDGLRALMELDKK
ncbi:UDP-N-acetylglucosamine 4,6-dehydratase (inverting) [Varunaivibrio sulfuroxidans]|uniref:UDP-N-acetylglucosamine 4,6-dehydratase n=1 Tax=Varunaivibrio sulfuroxidans TaxID=1773489 RepID=A0A4V2UNR0_9PROT|nr:UDP-N-acetylglucosamine 4,6-dehydratase (inverting) [Varunaivibrio sulfuroxidans]TCS62991.1 UDP-N-acetylglucosamine 4,6-dehydratase [Varunaivibrio sulfuroxidans]WES31931.1 UDP-N-acetylglucosamine 4,6-dehydratase (inverting) [Varunaivibrio sulfuroxidans]